RARPRSAATSSAPPRSPRRPRRRTGRAPRGAGDRRSARRCGCASRGRPRRAAGAPRPAGGPRRSRVRAPRDVAGSAAPSPRPRGCVRRRRGSRGPSPRCALSPGPARGRGRRRGGAGRRDRPGHRRQASLQCGIRAVPRASREVRLVLVALGFSWLGDTLPRLADGDAALLTMIGCFLLAQLVYAAAFWPSRHRSVLGRPLALLPYLLAGATIVGLSAREAGALLPAVAVYALAILAMAVLATGRG